jgi:hypothetical protein
MTTILGINPGTQSVGIAVLQDGKLTHWKVQKFQGRWSEGKRKAIMHFIHQCINRNKAVAVAVKIPDALPISDCYRNKQCQFVRSLIQEL